MKIKKIRIQNYKSIFDSGVIELGDNFNVVVGQNNSGKTAFLERFSFESIQHKPHRSSDHGSLHVLNPHSSTFIEIEMSGAEVRWALLSTGSDGFVPLPSDIGTDLETLRAFIAKYFERESISAQLRHEQGQGWRPFDGDGNQYPHVRLTPNADRQDFSLSLQHASQNTSAAMPVGILGDASFVFRAERLNVGTSGLQVDLKLRPDASNLAGVLNTLQGKNFALFDKLNAHVSAVLPAVKRVSVVPVGADQVTLQVSNEMPSVSAPDLSNSLSDCGTGVGQVLAILAVVMTSTFGRLIVIDEPNSFLHPRAVRELIRILKLYPQHQYLISTHAAEVVAAANPQKLILLQLQGTKSSIDVQDGNQIASVRSALDDVGVRLSDVFGYDKIVWVEGPTEAICFPSLALAAGIEGNQQPKFVSIVNTGDLESKRGDAELVWRVYERLSKQSILMPQTIAFGLDSEGRSNAQQAELKKRSKGLVRFLPRRTYENYLLNPIALVEVMPDLGSEAAVRAWLIDRGGKAPFYSLDWDGDIKNQAWLTQVDAPALLKMLFSEMTETKEEYRKTVHSVKLTEWLLKYDRDSIEELISFVANLSVDVQTS